MSRPRGYDGNNSKWARDMHEVPSRYAGNFWSLVYNVAITMWEFAPLLPHDTVVALVAGSP